MKMTLIFEQLIASLSSIIIIKIGVMREMIVIIIIMTRTLFIGDVVGQGSLRGEHLMPLATASAVAGSRSLCQVLPQRGMDDQKQQELSRGLNMPSGSLSANDEGPWPGGAAVSSTTPSYRVALNPDASCEGTLH